MSQLPRFVLIAALVLGLSTSVALANVAPDTAQQYRAKMNTACQINNQTVRKLAERMKVAAKKKDARTFYYTLGRAVGLMAIQDRWLEQRPYPVALRSRMESIRVNLVKIDFHIHLATGIAAGGDARGYMKELDKITPFEKRVATQLKGVGIRNCAGMYT